MTLLARTQKLEDTIYGNGKEGLTTITTKLVDKVGNLECTVKDMHTDLKVLLRFKTQDETEKEVTAKKVEEIERLKKKQNINRNWFATLTVGVIIALFGTIITLLLHTPVKEKNITDQEFKKLIEQYEKEKSPRGFKADSINLEVFSQIAHKIK